MQVRGAVVTIPDLRKRKLTRAELERTAVAYSVQRRTVPRSFLSSHIWFNHKPIFSCVESDVRAPAADQQGRLGPVLCQGRFT